LVVIRDRDERDLIMQAFPQAEADGMLSTLPREYLRYDSVFKANVLGCAASARQHRGGGGDSPMP
jgi:hypothetical protein